MNNKYIELFNKIKYHPSNEEFLNKGYDPLFSFSPKAKIVIIGQAPGIKAQKSKVLFNDKSGDLLRDWLGLTKDEFYDDNILSILPMDFYYPGKAKTGDLPPRKDFASKWHQQIISLMPNLKLIILLGSYSQSYYLKDTYTNLTSAVKNYQNYLPKYFPLPHPSPLNFRWFNKNPWFKDEVLEQLKIIINNILNKKNS